MIEANQSLVGGIQSFYAEVELSLRPGGVGDSYLQRADYWKSGDDIRIRIAEAKRIGHIERKQGKGRITTTLKKDDRHPAPNRGVGMLLVNRHRTWTALDAWELSLLSLPTSVASGPELTAYSLHEAAKAGRITAREPATLLGRSATHLTIELPHERRTYDVWCSMDLNGLILKTRHRIYSPSGSVDLEFETIVEELSVISPGLSLPSKVRYVGTREGKVLVEGRATLSNHAINRAVPKWPAFPSPRAGSMILDEVNNILFSVDAAGRMVAGTTKTLAGQITPIMPRAETDASGWSLTSFVVFSLSVSVLLAGCALLMRRKRLLDSVG
ncbi:MAG: hypothetical protein SFX72_13220 [Isosphaeraceae bacterium]|nr:hypothetical protein [Isosphaeraceae bacterium]